ncbi:MULTISPECIES: hypothetical protein [unclassified Butyrivibrio]|uniref:hypothetical protein n=1 Tax=unclassified Butyrivibrio TaxID=2639466 RepID=UPI0003B5BD7A|nr:MULTISPECIES: hypothetical protein [unclassified Butyrivibrio]SDB26705.1 hypothetical protein SAMN02910263_01275 [Butyrivibrio sp. INlla16]SEL26617.1 hypothetical protein SAMN04487770_10834 [Butyrivibrio sp. ob235]
MAIAGNISEKELYDAILAFDESEEAQDFYYKIMDTPTGRKNKSGSDETVRDRILKAYAMLFCEEAGLAPGEKAGVDEVADTADRLYIGSLGYDPQHWYRMKYHFPVIDEDNYDRFAALVLSDMNAGPLHDAALNDGETLVVGEADPLHMTAEQRKSQSVKSVSMTLGGQ